MGHTHVVTDTDARFVIDAASRKIKKATGDKPALMQYDHNSERYTFEMPRYIEGHDMSTCNQVGVHYLNIEQANKKEHSGLYEVDDIKIAEDESKVVFSWLIKRGATQYHGKLHFLVSFACVADGLIEYAWHTDFFTETAVNKGLDATGAFETEYVEIIERWKASVMAYFTGELDKWKTEALAEVHDKATADIASLAHYVTPQMYGAVADGVNDDTDAFQKAIASGYCVFVPDGRYVVSSVEVGGDVSISGNGEKSVIVSKGSGFVLNSATSKKSFVSLKFDCNTSSAITVNADADTVAYSTLRVKSCVFEANKNARTFAINLHGENEANVLACSFYGCNGIDIDGSINPNVSDCVFRHADIGIMYAHTGRRNLNSAYTCGLRISGTTILGCKIGVKAVDADNLQVDGCMIDYCDNPIILVGQSGAFLTNNFISSRFDNPAIYACINNGDGGKYGGNGLNSNKTEKLTISSSTILTHVDDYASSKVSAIVLCDCVHAVISNSHITWFTEDGIQLRDCVQTSLSSLHIACDSRMTDTSNVYAVNSYMNDVQEDEGSNHYFDIVSERRIFYHYATIRNVSNGIGDGFSDEVRGTVVVGSGSTSHTISINTPILGAVATLSNPSYTVGASFSGGTVTFTFDRKLEQNVRINYIIFCTR